MPHPFVDLFTPILGALGAPGAITVKRRAAGTWNADGTHTRGAETLISTDAVVQPSGPKELMKLPENERTKEAITVFTRTALQASDVSAQLAADLIVWKSREYEVQIVEDWTTQAQYARAIATRVGV